MLRTGHRYSQTPPSRMRRLISNIEIETPADGAFVAKSNFLLGELATQSKPTMNLWIGRTTHHLLRINGTLKLRHKKVVLIDAAEPLPNLSFLI
jgi:3-phenylpropionate/cinnamic acid dioxygenase small subunit